MNLIKNIFHLNDIKQKGDSKKLLYRYILSALGVLCIGIGCGFVAEMSLGCDTYTSFNMGIWYILKESFGEFPFGHINFSVNIILFIFMLLLRRDLIGFGTLFNMVAVGYIIDFIHYIFIINGCPGTELNYVLRIAVIVLSLPIIALGGALYIKADLGLSPFDSIPFVLLKFTKGKYGFGILRTLTDCFFLCGGFIFGLLTGKHFALVNIGTVLLALFTGVLIVMWQKIIGKPEKQQNN